MAMNDGLKKYNDFNRDAKAAGGVDSYKEKIYNKGYSKGLGNRLIAFGEDLFIIGILFILIGKLINRKQAKKEEKRKRNIDIIDEKESLKEDSDLKTESNTKVISDSNG